MKFSRSSLFALAAVSLLAAPISAASSLPNLSDDAKSAAQTTAAKKTSDSNSANTDSANTGSANTGSGNTGSQTGSADASKTGGSDSAPATTAASGSKLIQSSSAVITGSGSAITITGAIPTITGGSAAASSGAGALPTGLPTLSGAFVIVKPSVPPTTNAPFMQVSNLPEGTVFIAVGAILGFFAMGVLLWRGLVSWSLHRSVKRAAAVQNMSDTKAGFKAPKAPFYKYSDRDSTISLGPLGAKSGKKGGRPTTANGAASASSLFFSPTAGAVGGNGLANSGNRGSNYLPAGYYAAGASAPGNGQGMAHHGPAISLTNLGPARDGYARARSMGTTPPDSPMFRPQSSGAGGHAYGASSSTLNLTRDGDVRAPSAYLDDLFDGDNAPPLPIHGGRNDGSPHRF